MTFDVEAAHLAMVPHMLDRLADDAEQCATYARAAFDFDLGPGAINSASGVHAEVRATVTGYFATIGSRARRLSRSIDKCVRDYENMDAASAARFDALEPEVVRPDASRLDRLTLDIPQVTQRERLEPVTRLQPLRDYRPEWPYEPTWTDLLSPTNICRDAVMGVNWLAVQVGIADRIYDPLDNLAVPFFGNWAGMKACSDALRELSSACNDLQGNGGWIEARVNAVWQGNAADAAWVRLHELTSDIARGVPALDHFSLAYAQVVAEMAELEKITEIVVGEVIDLAVLALIAAYTAPTVIGPVLIAAARTVKIAATMEKLGKGVSLADSLSTSVDVFQGKVSSSWGVLDVDLENAGHLDYEKHEGVIHERL